MNEDHGVQSLAPLAYHELVVAHLRSEERHAWEWSSSGVLTQEGANGARGRSRTADTVIFSHVLYQLSYPGIAVVGRRKGALRALEARLWRRLYRLSSP